MEGSDGIYRGNERSSPQLHRDAFPEMRRPGTYHQGQATNLQNSEFGRAPPLRKVEHGQRHVRPELGRSAYSDGQQVAGHRPVPTLNPQPSAIQRVPVPLSASRESGLQPNPLPYPRSPDSIRPKTVYAGPNRIKENVNPNAGLPPKFGLPPTSINFMNSNPQLGDSNANLGRIQSSAYGTDLQARRNHNSSAHRAAHLRFSKSQNTLDSIPENLQPELYRHEIDTALVTGASQGVQGLVVIPRPHTADVLLPDSLRSGFSCQVDSNTRHTSSQTAASRFIAFVSLEPMTSCS